MKNKEYMGVKKLLQNLQEGLQKIHTNLSRADDYCGGNLYAGNAGDSGPWSNEAMEFVKEAEEEFINEHKQEIIERAKQKVEAWMDRYNISPEK